MREMSYAEAIEDALVHAMAADERVVIFGEDAPGLRMNLFARFGEDRVRPAPISESAFLGAAVGAAMAGLRPIVEIMLVAFIAVAADALVNQAAKLDAFSGGRWQAPMVVRSSCCGGYGDGGQHEQALWGWLAHIPGVSVVIPSTPADAGGLLLGALEHDGPVVFLEHKLLAEDWLDYLGAGGRNTVSYDVPAAGARGPVPDAWEPLPLGKAATRRTGGDLSVVGVGVAVHRALEAAERLSSDVQCSRSTGTPCAMPCEAPADCSSWTRTTAISACLESSRRRSWKRESRHAMVGCAWTTPFPSTSDASSWPYPARIESPRQPFGCWKGRLSSGRVRAMV
jgi:pyruvate dehydrogenase E1 component beta subunit